MASPTEKSLCLIQYAKEIHSSVFNGPCDFFLWGYVKDQVFVPLLPLDIDELKLTISAAIEIIDKELVGKIMGWTG
jgi:hypothetical protein